MKLGLGTVQFGLPYGATNRDGQVSLTMAGEMLGQAWTRSIDLLDTAAAYGDSEAVLGKLKDPNRPFRLVSKTLPLQGAEITDAGLRDVAQTFEQSLSRLQTNCLDTLLVHHAGNLLLPGGNRLYSLLEAWKASGRVRRIGASVYTGDELTQLVTKYRLDVIQLPLNVFDQRLPRAGWISRLHDMGTEVHARSLFLQGVLLETPAKLPPYLRVLVPHVEEFQRFATAQGLSPAAACFAYAEAQGVDYGIVGAVSADQLIALCDARDACSLGTELDWSRFALEDESLVNPARWSRSAC